MGCGSSKEVSVLAEPQVRPAENIAASSPVPEAELAQPEQLAHPEGEEFSDSVECSNTKQPISDAVVPELGMPLAVIERLGAELPEDATVDEVLSQVVKPQASRQSRRFAELDPNLAMHPTYYVQQTWGSRSYLALVHTIRKHIRHVEPDVDPDKVGVWLDLVCTAPDDSSVAEADLQQLRDFLPHTKPTLVCIEQCGTGAAGRLPATGKLDAGIANAGNVDGVVTLVMYRTKQGIHGFHLFDTVHVAYM
mmetsp:Transcript_39394/g.117174  ORF Transcript_39394/g.117174 Transcript_39394/m.117174 type:complete len:250 (-) Transcript_39394:993-1742(-)